MKVWIELLAGVILATGLATAQTSGRISGGGAGGGFVGIGVGVIATPDASGAQGMPFSADVINETTQVLADGNRIHQESHGKIYRDSQGRTRNEMEFPSPLGANPDFKHITIFDPIQQRIITLQPREKGAIVSHFETHASSAPARPSPAPNTIVNRVVRQGSSSSQNLGTKEIEGVLATGTRTTRTIPAGQFGNDKPLTVVTETWFSPDLNTIVLSETDDPRSGRNVMRLINIQRVEPDPALFEVPPDYTVKDQNRQ